MFQSYKNDSKHGELKEFYEILSDFKNYKPITIKTINRKNRILNNVNQLYNKYLDTYKKNTIVKIQTKKMKNFFDPNQFKILDKKKHKSEWTEENTERDAKTIMV